MNELMESKLTKPYLGINEFNDIVLPFEYESKDRFSIIDDFIHLSHPGFQHIKQFLINKSQTTSPQPPDRSSQPTIPFISSRKSYELTQFHNEINSIHKTNPFEFIIDIGAGNSNLSRLHNFPTIALEQNNRARDANKKLNGLLRPQATSQKAENVRYIRDLDLNQEDTLHFIRSRQRSNNDQTPKCLVVGLDCCGDLSNKIVGLMINDTIELEIIGCLFVGCCYHKVTKFVSEKLVDYGVNFKVFGTSDLRILEPEEIIKRFEVEQIKVLDGINNDEYLDLFTKWCFVYGFLTHVIESLVTYDKIEILRQYGLDPRYEIIFDMNKSSRNIAIKCIKK